MINRAGGMGFSLIDKGLRAGDLSDASGKDDYRWVGPVVTGAALLVGVLVFVVGLYMVGQGADIQQALLHLGYPGVSVVMFFSSATVFLPAPGFATVLAAGGLTGLNPWLLGLFAGLGSSVGELTGYLVGLGGRQVLHPERGRWIRRCEYFMRRWGFLTVLFMASFPNPFFDAVGVLAGSLGYPARRLWIACLIGNTVKYTSLALLGGSAAALFRE